MPSAAAPVPTASPLDILSSSEDDLLGGMASSPSVPEAPVGQGVGQVLL